MDHPVVLFDGVCNFCDATVNFLIARDLGKTLRFCPLQSERGRVLLAAHGLSAMELDTVVLIEDGKAWVRTTGLLRALRRLGAPWALAGVFLAIPAPLRDAAYRLFARNRYRLFGRKDACMMPTPDVRDRFLD